MDRGEEEIFSVLSACPVRKNDCIGVFSVVNSLRFRFTPLDTTYIRGYRTEKGSYPTGFIRVRFR